MNSFPTITGGGADPLPPIKPLIVPVVPVPGASLIGLVAEATDANVLGSTSVILEEVAPRLLKPGLVGQVFGPYAHRLALKIGCDVGEIRDRLHGYVSPDFNGEEGPAAHKGNWCRPIRWGTGALERHHLEIGSRRISPSALASADHHRKAWMCTLLPYCLETLERLVSRCGRCAGKLGWHLARGIGTCEHCRKPVPPSAEQPLAPRWVDSYKSFAALISTSGAERKAALRELFPALQDLEPTALVRLIVGLGRALDLEPDSYRHTTVVDREDPTIAIVVARGFEAIQDWPLRLRDELERITSDPAAQIDRRELQSRIRRVGGYRVSRPVHDDLLRDAAPEMFEPLYRSMNFKEPVVLATETYRRIGIGITKFRAIEDAKQIVGTDVMKGERLHRQYLASRSGEIANAWRGSRPAVAVARYLGVPLYGIEQLACIGRLTREGDPAIAVLDPFLRVSRSSADALIADLEAVSRRESPPPGCMSLAHLSSWRGGGMKPWASALILLGAGEVACWRDPAVADPAPRGSNFAARTLVLPSDAARLFGGDLERGANPAFHFAADVCRVDAADVLNADFVQMRRVIAAEVLRFAEAGRRGPTTSLDSVLSLARRAITASELGFLLNQNSNFVCRMMARHPSVQQQSLGWRRGDVLEHWPLLVDAIVSGREHPRARRVRPAALPEGHAELAFGRLKASLSCSG